MNATKLLAIVVVGASLIGSASAQLYPSPDQQSLSPYPNLSSSFNESLSAVYEREQQKKALEELKQMRQDIDDIKAQHFHSCFFRQFAEDC